jgi:hypothetical protein
MKDMTRRVNEEAQIIAGEGQKHEGNVRREDLVCSIVIDTIQMNVMMEQ